MCNHKGIRHKNCEDCMGGVEEWYEEHPVKTYFSWDEFVERLISLKEITED